MVYAMIELPIKIQKSAWLKRGILSLLVIGCIGGITIAALKLTNTPRATTTTKDSVTQQGSISELKASAFDKLTHGDQSGGVKDLEQALAIAKATKDSAQVTYFEQQIDFAKNSAIPDTKKTVNTSAPAPSTDSKDKNYTTF
jgi:hypothetical protein